MLFLLLDFVAAFRMWDGNQDGKLTADEITSTLGEQILNTLIAAKIDADGDGLYTRDELQEAFFTQ